MESQSYYIRAEELAEKGKNGIPQELVSHKNLIYSSPATLAYNSPGALGFGVKRAGLAVPDSVMLLVAPGCCGRNTTMLGGEASYAERFFYLLMDETDIVTGRHLYKIPAAVQEVVDSLDKKPSAVMICITCVDALLGTDMERVCKKAKEKCGVPVVPCYMYALTREGRVPPMTAVRKSIYSLLTKREKNPQTVNILGEFAPLMEDTELYELLHKVGIKQINEIARCKTFEEYEQMAEANFNLVINPEANLAAEDIYKRLDIPSISLARVYQIDKIHRQYQLLSSATGLNFDDTAYYEEAEKKLKNFMQQYKNLRVAIGECLNANAFELALALLRYGCQVEEIYATVTKENFIYIRKIAELSPDTRIYTNVSPTMLHYHAGEKRVDITIGTDAGYYQPGVPNVPWNEEIIPFGYKGLCQLLEKIRDCLQTERGELP